MPKKGGRCRTMSEVLSERRSKPNRKEIKKIRRVGLKKSAETPEIRHHSKEDKYELHNESKVIGIGSTESYPSP